MKMRLAPNAIGLRSESCPLAGNVICSLAGRSAVSHLGTSGPSELDLSKKSMFRCDIWVPCPCGCIQAAKLPTNERSLLMKLGNSRVWRRKTFVNVYQRGHRKLAHNVGASLETVPGRVPPGFTSSEQLS